MNTKSSHSRPERNALGHQYLPAPSGVLQRKCACGGTPGPSGECKVCRKNKLQRKTRNSELGTQNDSFVPAIVHEVLRSPGQPLDADTRAFTEPRFGHDFSQVRVQTKLAINEPGDEYEQEADRIANQVMATPAGLAVSGAPPRIQRFSGQSNGEMDTAPASVDQALATPGRPLEPALQQDMEQRFDHNFSTVRVHSGAAAEQSAKDVNADAYTVGHDIVFGAGRFSPGTHEGQRLIAHELTHVVQQSGARIDLPSAAGNRAPASRLLRQPSSTGKPSKPPVKTPQELAEDVWTSLLVFSARATPELARVGKSLKGYLERYDAAYASFTARLNDAQKEAAARQKWADVMIGIVIGTGVGLAAGALYTATTIVRKIAYEAVGEGAEAVIGGALGGSSAPDFTPPPELNNDKVARAYLEKLLEAWQALAIMQSATLAFSPRRDALRDAARGTDPSAKDEAQKNAAPKVADELERLKAALAAADKALTTFLTTLDTPLLRRDQLTVEQDIWIAWMGHGAANAGAVLGDDPIGRRLKEIGIIGRLVRPGEVFDPGEELSEFARAEQARVEQIGHVGVVIVPPRRETGRGRARPGVVRLRHDAYAAVGRKDPGTTGGNDYVQFVWEARTYLRPGEVVMMTSTKSSGLVVEKLGPSLPVAKDERQSALHLLGIKEAEYQPEAAEALWPYVWGAVNWYMKDEPPPLQLSSSEDGVLVSEADGKKLVLFAPLTDSDWMGAAFRRDRSGASRVVAIGLDAQQKVEEFRAAGVVVTGRSDMFFIADEIRAARRAVGQKQPP